jgi:multidrug resistance efflux pump
MANKISFPAMGRMLITFILVAIAILAGMRMWHHYEVEPWTRDGRVKTNVVQIAPDVTGPVAKMYVRDNQPVHAGDVLFEVDRARFELALRQAEAAEHAQRAALELARKEARRNTQLRDLVAQETREQGQSRVEQAAAALEQAEVARETAKLNLERTRVVAPVNGFVTNLDLHTGGYVSAGRPVLALVDRDAFYVEGYFEETKIDGIHVGDQARIKLMGQPGTLAGHVDSFAEGIADRDRSTSSNLLPNINPTFNWVRLAQRVPVRIAIDRVPSETRLVAGQTATVEVLGPGAQLAANGTVGNH